MGRSQNSYFDIFSDNDDGMNLDSVSVRESQSKPIQFRRKSAKITALQREIAGTSTNANEPSSHRRRGRPKKK